MIERTIRNTLAFASWLMASFGLLLLNAVVLLANYLACKVSFELAGFENQPLDRDRLIGRFAGAIFGQATLADFYAMVVAAAVALGAFLLFKLLFALPHHLEQRQLYRHAGDLTSARIVSTWLWFDAAVIGLLSVGVAAAMLWDIDLFRYRSLSNAFSVDDPAVAAGSIPEWGRAMEQYGDLFSVHLAKIGPAGYLAVTLISCLALEYALHKTRTAGVQLLRDVAALAEVSAPYDGSEATEPQAPEAVANGNVEPSPDAGLSGTPGSAGEPLFDPVVVGRGATSGSAPEASEATVGVIGGADGERVLRSDARAAADRYHVDDATGLVWDRAYWEQLHGTAENDQAEAA